MWYELRFYFIFLGSGRGKSWIFGYSAGIGCDLITPVRRTFWLVFPFTANAFASHVLDRPRDTFAALTLMWVWAKYQILNMHFFLHYTQSNWWKSFYGPPKKKKSFTKSWRNRCFRSDIMTIALPEMFPFSGRSWSGSHHVRVQCQLSEIGFGRIMTFTSGS